MGRFRRDDFQFGEYGFEDDGYDYSQHFVPSGGGRFIPAIPLPPAAYAPKPGALTTTTLDELLGEKKGPKLPAELFGLTPNATTTTRVDFEVDEEFPPELIPKEVDELLEKEDEPEGESDQLEDDFVLQAAGGEVPEEEAWGEGFTYDEDEDEEADDDLPPLEPKLPRKKREVTVDVDGTIVDGLDAEEEDEGEEEEEQVEERPARVKGRRIPHKLPTAPAKPTLLDQRFEVVARAYEDDQIGELAEDDAATKGALSIDLFTNVLDEFLAAKKKDRVYVKPAAKPGAEGEEEEEEEEGEEEDDEAGDGEEVDEEDEDEEDEEARLPQALKPRPPSKPAPSVTATATASTSAAPAGSAATPSATPTASSKEPGPKDEEAEDDEQDDEEEEEEEEFEVIEIKESTGWDCQSIISTYSNTENHPAVISEPGRRAHPKIELSKKTGIPLGVLPGKKPKEPEAPRENLGVPRARGETAEEKKARKQGLKDARRQARERKQQLKGAFKSEEKTQLTAMRGQPVKQSIIKMQ